MLDHSGKELKVGDAVMIPAKVVQVHHDPVNFPKITAITVETIYPVQEVEKDPAFSRIYLEGVQVDKQEAE